MRIPFLCIVLSALAIFVKSTLATLNVTIDNTDPLVIYSPQPCYVTPPPNCSPEWQLTKVYGALNGTTTSSNGSLVASGLNILPRVTLTFQGISILYVPGRDSNATATVVVDDLPSVLVDTARDAFSGVGLDPATFHTITITFTPPATGRIHDVLSVDYFQVGQEDKNSSSTTSATSTVLTPAPLPSPTISLTTSSTTLPFIPTGVPSSSVEQDLTTSRPAPGTIAAISLSAALLLLLSGMAWLFMSQRRRRRHRAVMREAEILQGTRLPSSSGMEEAAMGFKSGQSNSMGIAPAKTRLLAQREVSMLPGNQAVLPPPPVHSSPWRP